MNAYELAEENYNSARTLPARPTDARPGTKAKIEVMRRRWTDGEHLHHPLDRQMDSDDRRAESRIRQFGRLVLKRGAQT